MKWRRAEDLHPMPTGGTLGFQDRSSALDWFTLLMMKWCSQQDLHLRPPSSQNGALSAELWELRCVGPLGGICTHTYRSLNPVPLLVGLQGEGLNERLVPSAGLAPALARF